MPRHTGSSTQTTWVEIREYSQSDDSWQNSGEVDMTQRRNSLGKPLVDKRQLTAAAVMQNHVKEFPSLFARP